MRHAQRPLRPLETAAGDILKAAEGCVLVIDEAYALHSGNQLSGTSDPYGEAVITTLVEQIQPQAGSDIAIIFLGYKDEMTEMFNHCNPGLKRRLQFERAFEFPDYRSGPPREPRGPLPLAARASGTAPRLCPALGSVSAPSPCPAHGFVSAPHQAPLR